MKKFRFNKKIKLSRDMTIFLISIACVLVLGIALNPDARAVVSIIFYYLMAIIRFIIFYLGIPFLIVVAIRYFIKNTKEEDK